MKTNGVLSTQAMLRSIRKTVWATKSVLYRSMLRKESVGREPPYREDLSAEAEESTC
jgi:hypothetical protein